MNYLTNQEGVTTIKNLEGELIGLIHKDDKTHKNIFFKCEEMGMSELEEMLSADIVKIKSNE